jgi:hypothetical protein
MTAAFDPERRRAKQIAEAEAKIDVLETIAATRRLTLAERTRLNSWCETLRELKP